MNWRHRVTRLKRQWNRLLEDLIPKRAPKYRSSHKMCPDCGKFIDTKAITCPYCKAQVGHLDVRDDRGTRALQQNRRDSIYAVFGICVFFFVLAAIRSLSSLQAMDVMEDLTITKMLKTYGAPISNGELGAIVPSLVLLRGEFWRLATYMFLHANIIHIAFNLYALALLGPMILDKFGLRRFWVITLTTGIIGGLATTLIRFSDAGTVGFSGALFGYLGAVYVHARASGDVITAERFKHYMIYGNLLMICITFFAHIGQMGFAIDNVCHLGGMFAGMGVGTAMFRFSSSRAMVKMEYGFLGLSVLLWAWGLVEIYQTMG